jgi:hypothetical protein
VLRGSTVALRPSISILPRQVLPCYLPRSGLFYNPRMRTQSKRKAQRVRRSASTPEPATEPTTQAEASSPEVQPASSQTDGSRIAFPTNADGTLDDDAIRSVTREKLKVVFLDPKLREKLGIDAADTATAPMVIPLAFFEKAADLFHDTLGKLAAVAVVRQGYSLDDAKAMLLTTSDKETLNPLAAQALNDWCPSIDSKYQSLALLGAGYITVFGGKLATLPKKPADVLPFRPQEAKPPEREP